MICANRSKKDIANLEDRRFFHTIFTKPHLYTSIKHNKNLLAIVNMPMIWLICPVETSSDATNFCNCNCTPWTFSSKIFRSDNFHYLLYPKKINF